jgi:hypothetical protein
MADHGKAPSEDSFEFIETPPAPSTIAKPADCGVRTTAVRSAILFDKTQKLIPLN